MLFFLTIIAVQKMSSPNQPTAFNWVLSCSSGFHRVLVSHLISIIPPPTIAPLFSRLKGFESMFHDFSKKLRGQCVTSGGYNRTCSKAEIDEGKTCGHKDETLKFCNDYRRRPDGRRPHISNIKFDSRSTRELKVVSGSLSSAEERKKD